jgi:hypothetical protein
MEPTGRIARTNVVSAKLPIAGYIRTGEKRLNASGKEYPVSLDYFKATGDYAAKFHEELGDKPTRIQIVFVSDDIAESCKEEYDGRNDKGRKLAWGDGQNYYLYDFAKKEYVQEADKAKVRAFTDEYRVKWSVTLTLTFIVLAMRGIYALWMYQTKGIKSSLPQIRDTFDMVLAQAGTIQNIPFDLVVKKVKGQKPGDTTTYPVVQLIPNVSKDNLTTLHNFLSSGGSIDNFGLLDDGKISQLALNPAPQSTIDVPEEDYVTYDDSFAEGAVKQLNEVKTVPELQEIWNIYQSLHDNEDFNQAYHQTKLKLTTP